MCLPSHPPQGFCEIWENKRWNLGQKRRFSGWFGAVLSLGISHPTHPHLGKLSQIKPFFYSSPNGYWTLSFAIKTIILTNLLDWSCPDDPSLVNWNEKTKNCGCVSSTAVWQPNDSLLLRPRPARLFTILTLLCLKEKKDVFALYWYSSYCGNCRALFISFFAVDVS